jgi:hypothetical protein
MQFGIHILVKLAPLSSNRKSAAGYMLEPRIMPIKYLYISGELYRKNSEEIQIIDKYIKSYLNNFLNFIIRFTFEPRIM